MSLKHKPLVYVAGQFTQGKGPVTNTHNFAKLGIQMIDDGMVTPIVPHLNLVMELADPRDYNFYLDYDHDLIRHCDALLRMDGHSPGADTEVQLARQLGIPVFYFIEELYEWALMQHQEKEGLMPVMMND